MAKIRFKWTSQAAPAPPSNKITAADGNQSATQMDTQNNSSETNEQPARIHTTATSTPTPTTINLNHVVQSRASHQATNTTTSNKPTSDKSIKRTKTSAGFKFLPSFYFSSSSSSSPSSTSSSSSSSSSSKSSPSTATSPSPTPDSTATSNSVRQQRQPNAGVTSRVGVSQLVANSKGNSLRGKSKRFSLSSSSVSASTNATTTNNKSNHSDALAAVAATLQASSSASASANATTKANIITNSSNKTVISTPLPPYEIEVTDIEGSAYIECPLCVLLVAYETTPDLRTCGHRTCAECMQRYLKTEISHSRLNITCPICSEPLLQNVIRQILNDDKFYFKYESFMLRKVLAAEPDARWCPAPDCGYAVLANGCASCPRLLCERDGCNTAFCYHCKQEWHPNQTCTAASAQRNKRAGLILNALNISDLIEESTQSNGARGDHRNNNGGPTSGTTRKSSKTSQQQNNATLRPEDIKECPVCSSRIIKMNDGSCNHMTCSICETEFCWLCMKEISDFHYFSPSGCTFWGKKPWSRKKKFLWRLGMLVGAPVCIVFIAGISIPAIVIGIPFWAARKLHARLEKKQFSRYRKNTILTGGVLLSFLVSPIITAMALAVGIPLLLGYVYGVVPLSLCRSSGGCLSATPSVENLHEQFTQAAAVARRLNNQATDVVSIDTATSRKLGNPSIGGTSMYLSNISLETNSIGHVTHVERAGDDRESASNAGLAGSLFSQAIDDGNSIRALAGSIISKDSGGYTLIPVEIHSHSGEGGPNQAPPSPSTSTSPCNSSSSTNNNNNSNDQPTNHQQSMSDVNNTSEQAAPTAALTAAVPTTA